MRLSMYKGFLEEVSWFIWFMATGVQEKSQITDALKPELFNKGDRVMKHQNLREISGGCLQRTMTT